MAGLEGLELELELELCTVACTPVVDMRKEAGTADMAVGSKAGGRMHTARCRGRAAPRRAACSMALDTAAAYTFHLRDIQADQAAASCHLMAQHSDLVQLNPNLSMYHLRASLTIQ